MKKTSTRVQFEMPDTSYQRLVALKDKIEASSHAEVIRRALQLYEFVITEAEKGGEISVRCKDGTEEVYRPIF